jgi:membrane-bound lytic murein transglycosylase D
MEERQENTFFEKSVINWLLVICLALGFICLMVIYLPQSLKGKQAIPVYKQAAAPVDLLAFMPQEEKTPAHLPPENIKGGLYARFVPEPNPPPAVNSALQRPENTGQNDNKSSETLMAQRATPLSAGKTHETSSLASYNPSYFSSRDKGGTSLFAVPPGLEADVAFWRDIFTKYDSHHVVLHDMEHLQIIYGILNFTNLDLDTSINNGERQRRKEERINAEKNNIISILELLAQNPDPNSLSNKEFAVKRLFRDVGGPDKFKEAAKRGVRAQTGQRDKFADGLKYSGRYLGEIEKIFMKEKLPVELTRLIFVESMFNPYANSSANARGIWQFMKGTGKIYGLKINSVMDERVDPINASYAAARLLRHNYEQLGTWPLAINAYNTGRGTITKAVARLGTTDITKIIRQFDHPSYGFASRNFYIEFLAVLDAVKNFRNYFADLRFDEPLSYDVIWTNEPIMLPAAAKKSGIPLQILEELNPAYKDSVFAGVVPFPARSELRVPKGKSEIFLAMAERLPSPFPFWHTVSEDETIYEIADMYNVSLEDIQRANKYGKRLRPGQRVRIER